MGAGGGYRSRRSGWPVCRGLESLSSNVDAALYGPVYVLGEGELVRAVRALSMEATTAPYGRLLFFWDSRLGYIRLVAPTIPGKAIYALLIHAVQVYGEYKELRVAARSITLTVSPRRRSRGPPSWG